MAKKNNNNLTSAKKAKNDEFYTQYADIQTEVNAYLDYNPDLFKDKIVLCPCDDPEWSNFTKFFAQNFKRFGLKKFISTSYSKIPGQLGKIFWIDRDVNGDGKIDINDLQWDWLLGDGDFRSLEVTRIRDQVDFVITNPPFSLFREFMDWIWAGPGLQFSVIGNMNAITYKEIFPKIKDNWMWIGIGSNMSLVYKTPYTNDLEANRKFVISKGYDPDQGYIKVPAVCWFTNIEHGRRHQPLYLMTAEENLRLSKHSSIKGKTFDEAYPRYDNYDAIEVSFTDAIPKDYEGIMGVPISFLDKYCPEQFEILGILQSSTDQQAGIPNLRYYNDFKEMKQDMTFTGSGGGKANGNPVLQGKSNNSNFLFNPITGEYVHSVYARIVIRLKSNNP